MNHYQNVYSQLNLSLWFSFRLRAEVCPVRRQFPKVFGRPHLTVALRQFYLFIFTRCKLRREVCCDLTIQFVEDYCGISEHLRASHPSPIPAVGVQRDKDSAFISCGESFLVHHSSSVSSPHFHCKSVRELFYTLVIFVPFSITLWTENNAFFVELISIVIVSCFNSVFRKISVTLLTNSCLITLALRSSCFLNPLRKKFTSKCGLGRVHFVPNFLF